MNDQPREQVQYDMQLGSKLTHWTGQNIEWKITQFNDMCGTIRIAVKG